VPTDEKAHKIWYLQLLENQIKHAESVSSKLFDFVSRLQIDIHGCLTAEAQIKACTMNLTSCTTDAVKEIKLLMAITQLIKGELDSVNPFADQTLSSLDLQS
jgi:hypothetical protein